MRTKGKTTKAEIVAAACTVFAEKGYHGTTTHDICTAAGVNISAVNYHFGSKDNLYLKVWEKLEEEIAPFVEMLDLEPDPKVRLKKFIDMRVRKALTDDSDSWHPNLIHKEMGQPSPEHDYILKTFIKKKVKWIHKMIKDILGESEIDDDQLSLLVFCIHSPMIHMLDIRERFKVRKNSPMPMHKPELVAETIYRIALAGLNEYKNNGV